MRRVAPSSLRTGSRPVVRTDRFAARSRAAERKHFCQKLPLALVSAVFGNVAVLGGLVLALGLGGFAIAAIYHGVGTVRESDRREEYVPVEAQIREAYVEKRQTGRRGYSYRPQVEYEYTVDGETYTSDNVYPGSVQWGESSGRLPREIVEPYEKGDRVGAYYDPEDPSTAFLEAKSTDDPAKVAIVTGAVLLLVALGVIVVFVLPFLLG